MYKKIPGNPDYRINLQKQIINTYGELVEIKKINHNTVVMEMFNKQLKVSLDWLARLAWYEADSIERLDENLDKIKFLNTNKKILSVSSGCLMCFTDPIYYKEGFRYISPYPRYAISTDGVVIDTFTNQLVPKYVNDDGYEVVYIYSPDKNGNKTIRMHRLLAFAWIPNNDFINKPIINHIDGCRSNNSLENLEWCNTTHNAVHALETGLTKTQIKMKTRDIITGEVVIYNSISDMARKIGSHLGTPKSLAAKLPGYLYQKRYEIKVFDDNTPWYYEEQTFTADELGKSFYTIETFNKKTGERRIFSKVKAFYRTYGLWVKTGKLDDAIVLFKLKYKDFDVSYKKNAIVGPYSVMDIVSKKIAIFNAIWEVGKYINRSTTEIQYDLSRNHKFIYSNKWIVTIGVGDLVLEEYRDKPNAFNKVIIVDEKTNRETTAQSIKHAARITGLDRKTITAYLNTEKVFKGLKFRALK